MYIRRITIVLLKVLFALLCLPFVVFLTVAALLYVPAVQDYAVRTVCQSLSENSDMTVKADEVRLRFPLSLSVKNVIATQQGDTLLMARDMRLSVEFMPLLRAQANIDGIGLTDAKLNTKSLIGGAHIRGTVGSLRAKTEGVGWETERVRVNYAALSDADLLVCLSDTALDDTVTTKAKWVVDVYGAKLDRVRARVALPAAVPDTARDTVRTEQMWVFADVETATLENGHFDTGKPLYALEGLALKAGTIAYRAKGEDGLWTRRGQMQPIPDDRQRSHIDSLRSWWAYADNMEGLAAWLPAKGSEAPKGGSSGNKLLGLGSAMTGAGGLDTENILLSDVNICVRNLSYDERGVLQVDVDNASLKEKSGIAVDNLNGKVYMDNERLRLPALSLKTPYSTIGGKIDLPWSALSGGGKGMTIDLDSRIGWQDVKTLGKGYLPSDILKLYPQRDLTLKGKVSGTLNALSLHGLTAAMPGVITADLRGQVNGIESGRLSGKVAFQAKTGAGLPVLYQSMLPDVARTVHLPANMSASGIVGFAGDDYTFDTRLHTGGGAAKIKGRLNSRNESYMADISTDAFPLQTFLPGMGLSPLTASLHATGHGFNPMARGTVLNAEADIKRFFYYKYDLKGIDLDARIRNGVAVANFNAANPNIVGTGTITSTLSDPLQGTLRGRLSKIDLLGLGLSADTVSVGAQLTADFLLRRDLSSIHVDAHADEIGFTMPRDTFATEDIFLAFDTEPDTTAASVRSGDLSLALGAKGGLSRLGPRLSRLADEAMRQIDAKELNQQALQRELPPMFLKLHAGQNNPVSRSLKYMGYSFRSINADINAHPHTGLNGNVTGGEILAGKFLLDTLKLAIEQDSTGLQLDGFVKNYTRHNPTKFEAKLDGSIMKKGVSLQAQVFDTEGEKGIDLGLRADLVEDGYRISLFPHNPVLAYRNFSINSDNYIYLGNDRKIRADVNLLADDGTGLKIYSAATDSVNDITLSLNNINLKELSNVVPYLPKMEGMLAGDFHVFDNHKTLSAMGSITTEGFAFDGTRLGNLGADVVYLPKGDGEHYASAYISSEGIDVMEAEGTYVDKGEGLFDGTAHLHDFPLAMVNAFMEGTDILLRGKGEGDITVYGPLSKPALNGELLLDSAHVYSDVYGFDFRMEEKPLTFVNSKLSMEDYKLYSTGKNPLVLNGAIDMQDLSRISLNIGMKTNDFELINTKQNRKSMIFGKLFTDFIGSVSGTLNNLSIRGKLDVLEKTNMTYILRDSPLNTDNRLDNLVTFTSFTDSIADTPVPEETPSNIDIVLAVGVDEAAHFGCYLSEDGRNYANIEGGGNLTLRMTPQGEMRLTGRLTAHSGDMKYELPIIPLRTFNLVDGSTIEFTGDPANPTLNIKAKERMKVLVTENEQQRSVAFDVGVEITKPLDQMGLEFTIEAPEDLSVQNQLTAMSKEQRNKAAVAMMATGMYLTDSGGMSSGFKANNALNAFLQNEIQNIAGNALKTIDLSVGVETGTSLAGTQTTDYSFQFAKRFWDDKIRVIIGGRVSAGKNADNRAESLINNVSVEYRMNKGASRYLRVFYERDSQDPLEGLLSKTGVGYSVRRKADRFGDLFIFWKRKDKAVRHEEAGSEEHGKN